MSAILEKVVGPDVIAVLGPQPDASSARQPLQPALLAAAGPIRRLYGLRPLYATAHVQSASGKSVVRGMVMPLPLFPATTVSVTLKKIPPEDVVWAMMPLKLLLMKLFAIVTPMRLDVWL
jgi:hypothetical protein